MTDTLTRRIVDVHQPGSSVVKRFILSGPEGAVTFDIYGGAHPMGGPVEIHYPVSPASEHICQPGAVSPNNCEFVPGGHCRADQAWRAGGDAYEQYAAGREGGVWAEMQSWYDSRLRGC
jgi:hypothetical protein